MMFLMSILFVSCAQTKTNTNSIDLQHKTDFPSESKIATDSSQFSCFSDADVLKHYENCFSFASAFLLNPDDFGLDMDYPYPKNKEENIEYYRIKNINLKNTNSVLETKQDLIDYMCNYFSRDIAENLFNQAVEKKHLLEKDEKIWALAGSKPENNDYKYTNSSYSIIREYDEDSNCKKIILKIDVNIFESGNFLTQTKSFLFNCEYIDNHWVFTKFVFIPSIIDDFYKENSK